MENTSRYYTCILAQKVIATAKVNMYRKENGDEETKWKVMDWAAYIDAVPGQNHDEEYKDVARTGSKLSEKNATHLFPRLPAEKYRR